MALDFLPETSAAVAALFCIEKMVFAEIVCVFLSSKRMTCSCFVPLNFPQCSLSSLSVSSCLFSATVKLFSLVVFKVTVVFFYFLTCLACQN